MASRTISLRERQTTTPAQILVAFSWADLDRHYANEPGITESRGSSRDFGTPAET
jgi:hypothetical protein